MFYFNRYNNIVFLIGLVILVFGIFGCASKQASGQSEMNSKDTKRTEQVQIQEVKPVNDITRHLTAQEKFTLDSTVNDVIRDKAFANYGRLLFPVDIPVDRKSTLAQVSSSDTYIWYNYIQPQKTVEIVNYLKEQSINSRQIFHSIYTPEEIQQDRSKADTGLFFFRGKPGEKFAVMNAGGGFMYVGAMHDSFPHALEASKAGYNAFALIYRPNYAFDDLGRAITFIHDNASALQVNPNNYSLWGGSAGARMAAALGNVDYLHRITGRNDLPQAASVIMQYTGYNDASKDDAPTYVNVGTNDGIASWRNMQRRLNRLEDFGIPTEFHAYNGLPHGYGIGTGTVAEGWLKDAFAFWEKNSK